MRLRLIGILAAAVAVSALGVPLDTAAATQEKHTESESELASLDVDSFAQDAIVEGAQNYSVFIESLNNLYGLMESTNFAEDLAVSASAAVVNKVESFGTTVDSMCEILDTMHIPPDMLPLVNYVKTQLKQASNESKQVIMSMSNNDMDRLDRAHSPRKQVESEHKKWHSMHKEKMKPHYEKLRSHPKVSHYMATHEALMAGDTDILHAAVKKLSRDNGSNGKRRRLEVQEECQRLVSCVEEYTLYDLLVFFYGPYLDDSGKLQANMEVEDAAELFQKVTHIRDKIERAKQEYGHDECKDLLLEFHTNENKGDFVVFHGSAVSTVCRAKGSTKYIRLDDIRKNISEPVANYVFDDLVKCSTKLGDSTFFNDDGTPRIPTALNQDQHGANKWDTKTVDQQFTFKEASPLAGAVEGGSGKRMAFDAISQASPDCVKEINNYYKEIYANQNPAILNLDNNLDDATFPPLQMIVSKMMRRVYIGIGADSGKPKHVCEIQYNFATCPNDKSMTDIANYLTDCPSGDHTYTVSGLFGGFDVGESDRASLLAFGEKVSVGLVCAYAEKERKTPSNEKVAGWCCMDNPHDRLGSDWGIAFSCEDGIDTCMTLAPVLAGMSASACEPWSGTWCQYPRDCSDLRDCLQTEVDWATTNEKVAYLNYLDTAPVIEDTNDLNQCSDVREYYGFDRDYPLDDEICEDVSAMRNDRNFDALDQNFGSDSALPSPGKPSNKPELVPPPPPETTADEYDGMEGPIKSLKITLLNVEQVANVIGSVACAGDFSGIVQTACAVVKNVMATVAYVAQTAMALVKQALEFAVPLISAWQNMDGFQNVGAIYGNMKIMNDGINGIMDGVFKLPDKKEADKEEEEEAGGKDDNDESRRHLVAGDCEGNPEMLCGFISTKNLSDDGKTLFVKEDTQRSSKLVDSGLYFDLKKSCLESATIDISITSNEFDSRAGSDLMVKGLVARSNEATIAKVFVSPLSCNSGGAAGFCATADGGKRFYEIQIVAKDGSGWSSQDICRVVVVPEANTDGVAGKQQQSELRGAPPQVLRSLVTKKEQDKMFDKSSLQYEIENFSFEWMNT